jgi:hypothetical protein
LKDLEEMNDAENIFVEDIEDKGYYPDWMGEYMKYHVLLN